jgi:hypothetical protein
LDAFHRATARLEHFFFYFLGYSVGFFAAAFSRTHHRF